MGQHKAFVASVFSFGLGLLGGCGPGAVTAGQAWVAHPAGVSSQPVLSSGLPNAFPSVPPSLLASLTPQPQSPFSVSNARSPRTIRIASYNVENLWDDDDSNTQAPYDDYAARSSNWTRDHMVSIKISHIVEALSLAGFPDVVGIQEVEWAQGHSRSLALLSQALRPMGYAFFALGQQAPDTAVTTAVLSKWPIVSNDTLYLGDSDSSARSPQVVTLDVGGSPVRLYNSHWKSKRGGHAEQTEPQRMRAAMAIREDMDRVRARDPGTDLILVGDLNSRYNETQIERRGPTGVVEGLRATGDERMMWGSESLRRVYNLWFELPPQERGSSSFRGEKNAIDHIIVSDALYDQNGLQYVQGSFQVVGSSGTAALKLLNADGTPLSWQVRSQRGSRGRGGYSEHLGVGYSDHLPVVADFYVWGPTGRLAKVPVQNPSTTEFGPGQKVYVRPASCAGVPTVPLSPELLRRSDALNICVESHAVLDVRKAEGGLTSEVGGEEFFVPLSHAVNRDSGSFSSEDDFGEQRNLIFLRGRLGFYRGRMAVFASSAQDLVLR